MRLLHGRNNLTAAAAELFPIRCAPHLLIAARHNSLVLASLSQFDEHPTDRRTVMGAQILQGGEGVFQNRKP